MPCKRDVPFEPLDGQLMGRPPISEPSPKNFRVLLNTAMPDRYRLGRVPGGQGLLKDFCGGWWHRDLHDQVVQCTGYFFHAHVLEDALIPHTLLASELTAKTVTINVTSTKDFVVNKNAKIRAYVELAVNAIDEVNGTITVRNNSTDPKFKDGGWVIVGDEIVQDWKPGYSSSIPANELPIREAITLIKQVQSGCEARVFVAGTRSRLYVSTGTSSNWRILF